MIKRIAVWVCAVLAAVGVYAQRPLTLMSYNVHNGVGLDGAADYARIGRLIKEVGPDVVAIQEVDSMTMRSGRRFVLGEIADVAGMKALYAPAIDYQGGKYGIGILCKDMPVSVKRVPLPGREEKRAMIIAEFDDYVFACTHLSLTEADCKASVAIINSMSAGYDKPFFVAGDFNARPDSEVMTLMNETFTVLTDRNIHTYPADAPDETIDYVMVRGGGVCCNDVTAEVKAETVASDHRPLVVRLNLVNGRRGQECEERCNTGSCCRPK